MALTIDVTVPEGHMQDARGRLVPDQLIKPIDKMRDELVREIVGRAKVQSGYLSAFKKETMADVAAFVELSAEQYGAKLGGKKGNVSLLSYDGRFKVERSIGEFISFNETLQAAKSLIDECINAWAQNSGPEIRVLVQDAFKTDQAGKIDTNRVLGLRRLDIQDEKWKTAMGAITDSIEINGSKSYIRVYERVGDADQWQQIPLHIAAL